VPVNTADIADEIASSHGLSKTEAKKIVDGVIGNISKAIVAGNEVRLPGLGILKVKSTKARTGRNPGTGEPIQIPASKKISFAASKTIKDEMAA
jgi:DNA-binding protein HU-beta